MKLFELAFPESQRLFNTLYYRRGGSYSHDFTTHASYGSRLPYAEAEDFFKRFSNESDLRILEIGCGNGNNAARFLERILQLCKKDKRSKIESINYTIADFSQEMLDSAKENPKVKRLQKEKSARIDFIKINAENFKIKTKNKFHLIRSNELLDDLPNQILISNGNQFSEIMIAFHLPDNITATPTPEAFIRNVELDVGTRKTKPEKKTLSLLKSSRMLVTNARTPIPFSAANLIKTLKSHLAENGTMDFFDYGFNSKSELLSLQHSIFRTPGALTCFVNFPFLKSFAEKQNLKAKVEPESKFTGEKSEHFYHLRIRK